MPKIYAPEEKKEWSEKILALVRRKSLRKACEEVGFALSTFEDWVDADESLSVQYLRARKMRAETLFEEALDIQDETPANVIQLGEEGKPSSSRVDPAHVAWQNHRANLRMRMIAKMDPKRFGDRVELEHSGEVKSAGPDLSRLPAEDLTAMRAILAKVDDAAPANPR